MQHLDNSMINDEINKSETKSIPGAPEPSKKDEIIEKLEN